MSTFNYPFWVGKLSDKGFQHCVSQLFPMLKFRYLKEEEVRRVDFSERMLELAERCNMIPDQKSSTSYEAYYKALSYYLVTFLKCKQGTVADGYRNKALEIIKRIEDDKVDHTGTDENLTVFSIYLGLARALYPNYSSHVATGARLLVDEDDAELLIKLKDYKFKTETQGLFKKVEEQTQEARDMIYMHNVIMYCLLMETQGEYEEEE